MEVKEIKTLARKCAEEGYAKFGDPNAITLMAGEYERVIECILKTHDIVPK